MVYLKITFENVIKVVLLKSLLNISSKKYFLKMVYLKITFEKVIKGCLNGVLI